MRYVGLRHFTYAGIRAEPGLVFPKLAVRNNLFLEQRGFVEEFRGREENLVPCQECPAQFTDLAAMQRHRDKNVHQDGRIIHSEEGIRAPEQEAIIDEIQARAKEEEKPGYVEASVSGEMSRETKRIKRRK